jgi:hypothetical protein
MKEKTPVTKCTTNDERCLVRETFRNTIRYINGLHLRIHNVLSDSSFRKGVYSPVEFQL